MNVCQCQLQLFRRPHRGTGDRAERSVPLRLRLEVQAVLRRGDGELTLAGEVHRCSRHSLPKLPKDFFDFATPDFPVFMGKQFCYVRKVT